MINKIHPLPLLFITAVALLCTTGSAAQTTGQDTAHREYYDNGHLKQVTHQGIYNGCGVPVGTDSLFDSAGKLIKSISYLHEGKNSSGCHDIITRQIITTYYQNGRHKTLAFFMGCYECELQPYGVWKWYDVNGKLIKSEKK